MKCVCGHAKENHAFGEGECLVCYCQKFEAEKGVKE